jgi:hypothetical protein
MRSCLDHIFTLVTTIENRYKKRQPTYVCFVDMKKAFDSVNKTCLLDKLRSIGVNGNMYFAVKTMCVNVSCAVRVNGMYTDWFAVDMGVKQGCILSPTLFSIYINDLAKSIKALDLGIVMEDYKLSVLLFADDIALVADSPQSLQTMLDAVSVWCNKWRLQINVDKTKVVHFRMPSVVKTDVIFRCSENVINVVDSYKYLGLMFNEHLDKSMMAKSVAKSANRALGLLIAKCKAFGGMPHDVFTRLYDALVGTVIEYAAAIWGHRECSYINTVQNRASRFYLGVSKFTPNSAVQGDMGWKAPWHRQKICVVRMWLRFVNMDVNRTASKIFWYTHGLAHSRCKNWCYLTMQMFDNAGLSHLREVDNCANKSAVLKNANVNFTAETLRTWEHNLHRPVRVGNNKLRTYRTFKTVFQTEMFLRKPIPFKIRQSFAMLRCGVAPLRIETGRYENVALENRVCQLCESGMIEDERHFLTSCTALIHDRDKLYTLVSQSVNDFNLLPDNEKFLFLMSDPMICKFTARACYEMFKTRRSILYK